MIRYLDAFLDSYNRRVEGNVNVMLSYTIRKNSDNLSINRTNYSFGSLLFVFGSSSCSLYKMSGKL